MCKQQTKTNKRSEAELEISRFLNMCNAPNYFSGHYRSMKLTLYSHISLIIATNIFSSPSYYQSSVQFLLRKWNIEVHAPFVSMLRMNLTILSVFDSYFVCYPTITPASSSETRNIPTSTLALVSVSFCFTSTHLHPIISKQYSAAFVDIVSIQNYLCFRSLF